MKQEVLASFFHSEDTLLGKTVQFICSLSLLHNFRDGIFLQVVGKMIILISMLTKDDLKQIAKLLEAERGQTKKLIEASEVRLTAKIGKVQETVDIVQNVVVEAHTKLEERVTTIERGLHPSKN